MGCHRPIIGVLNLTQAILEAFAATTVDVATTENDLATFLSGLIDAKAKPDVYSIFVQVINLFKYDEMVGPEGINSNPSEFTIPI